MTLDTEAGAAGREADAVGRAIEQRCEQMAAKHTEHEQAKDASADTATSGPAQESAEASAQAAAQVDAGEATPPPGETEGADAAAALPPIEPPRSWTKDDKALFTSLPRATQARLARRERSRESDFSRRQQEVTERAKALAAECAKLEQARQQYEQALPILLHSLHTTSANEFSDIGSPQDVQRLEKEDPPRYAQWDAHQKKLAALQQEIVVMQQHVAQEAQRELRAFIDREAALFAMAAPEIAGARQRDSIMSAAVGVLTELGFGEQELAALYRGERSISLHDHRLQLLIRDAIKLREAQVQATQAQSVPSVQRPGAAPEEGRPHQATHLQHLSRTIDNTKGMRALQAAARRVAERRITRG